MELNQIRYFLAVAETNSFARAAERFDVTQSALSRALKHLEMDVGTRLLERHGRGTVLTDDGERFRLVVTPLLGKLEQARLDVLARATQPSGMLTIGLAPSVMTVIGDSIVRETRDRFPHLHLVFESAFSGELVEKLRGGLVDIAVTAIDGRLPGVTTQPLGAFSLFHVVNRRLLVEHDNGESTVVIAQLVDTPLVMPARRHVIRRALEEAAERAGLHFTPIAECNAIAAILELTRSGIAGAVLPYGAIIRDVTNPALVLRRVAEPGLKTQLAIVHCTDRPYTSAMSEVARLISYSMKRASQEGRLIVYTE